MMHSSAKWVIALALSLIVHASLANIYREQPDEVKISGGSSFEVAILGAGFSDSVASGEPNDVIEPIKQDISNVEHSYEIKPLEAVVDDNSSTITPLQNTNEAAITPQISGISPLEPNATSSSEESYQEAALATPATIMPFEQQIIEPIIKAPAMSTIPVPQSRQENLTKAQPQKQSKSKKKEVHRKANKPQKKKKQLSNSGNRGNAKANTKSGEKSGKKRTASKTNGKKTRVASISGNAAVSNYPGKIVRKLRRSLRYPKAAKRKRIRGQVIVSFVVSKSGQASGIRLIRGSGSSILDKAALESVRRAAPFPNIPNEAKRSRWAFKVPLAFQ